MRRGKIFKLATSPHLEFYTLRNYPLAFKSEWKIKTFSDKQILRKGVAIRAALQGMC